MTTEHELMLREAWTLIPWAADLAAAAQAAALLAGTGAVSLAAVAVACLTARTLRSTR
ncbi:hypothetical protein ACIQGZ_17485 [Streptomyces sp. NPDC092296]|uniref:hypothetical protein n=1 Tax=Streptomyces sp. NPDC092296 TaxID=3366012 RepID=UPI0038296C88